MEIRSKRKFYELWHAGLLGNKPRTWTEAVEAHTARPRRVGFRQIGVAGGGAAEIVPTTEILSTALRWQHRGWSYMIDETSPDEDVMLQGEVCLTTRGWEGLLGLRTGMRMRYAMERGLLVPMRGLAVRALLRQHLDENSLNDVDELFELYPDAVIELASFPYFLGTLPRRNTIIWEVRNY